VTKEDDAHLWWLVEQRYQRGDNVALNILGSLYVDRALKERDVGLLDEAERHFRRAAELGNSSADAFIELTWTSLKAEYKAQIEGPREE
jgi:TPR repeat protein